MNIIIRHYCGYLVRYLRETRAVAAMEYAIIVGVVVVGVGLAVGQIPRGDRGSHCGCDGGPQNHSRDDTDGCQTQVMLG